MLLTDPLCHSATLRVAAPPTAVFAFMADGARLGDWAFGCWRAQALGDGLFRGTSLMSGATAYVRIHADAARRQVDYAVGAAAHALVPRIVARIIPAADMAAEAGTESCFLSLLAWRGAGASDEEWRRTCASHEAEVFRIRHLVESGE